MAVTFTPTAGVIVEVSAFDAAKGAMGDHWMTPVRVEYAVSRAT